MDAENEAGYSATKSAREVPSIDSLLGPILFGSAFWCMHVAELAGDKVG